MSEDEFLTVYLPTSSSLSYLSDEEGDPDHNQRNYIETEPISDLISSFNDLMKKSGKNSGLEKIEQFRILTVGGCQSLMAKFPDHLDQLQYFKGSSSIHDLNQLELESKIHELEFMLLPPLRQRILSLSISLDPPDITKQPIQKLELALKITQEIEQILDQLDLLFIPPRSKSARTHVPLSLDLENKNIITFRINKIVRMVTDIIEEIHRLFHDSCKFISDFPLSNKPNSSGEPVPNGQSVTLQREKIIQHTTYSWKLIDKLIEWSKLSNYKLIENELQAEADLVEDALNQLLGYYPKLIKDIINQPSSIDIKSAIRLEDIYPIHPVNEKTMKMTKLMIPIIKLVRLFLNKLCKPKVAKILSKMNLDQLSSLLALHGSISPQIDDMVESSEFFRDSGPNDILRGPSTNINGFTLKILSDHFDNVLDAVIPYLESIPSDQLDDNINLKTWLETWKVQFDRSSHKLIIETGPN